MAKSKNRRPKKKPKPKGALVLDVRRALNFSQIDFARVIGVHPITVSKWERGALNVRPWQQSIMNVLAKGERLSWSDQHEILYAGKDDPVRPLYLLLQRVYEQAS